MNRVALAKKLSFYLFYSLGWLGIGAASAIFFALLPLQANDLIQLASEGNPAAARPFEISIFDAQRGEKKRPYDPEEIVVTQGARFGLRLSFNNPSTATELGAGADLLSKITKHGLENFHVDCHGSTFSTTIINGKTTREVLVDCILTPKMQEGTTLLGPFTVDMEGRKCSWPAIKVTVKKAPVNDSKQNCFAVMELQGGSNCFVWQQKKLQIKIYFDPSVAKLQEVDNNFSIPDFDYKLIDQSKSEEVIDNRRYIVVTLTYAVTPQKVGVHEIPSISVAFLTKNPQAHHQVFTPFMIPNFFDDFGATQCMTRSNCLHVNVLDLPTENKNVAALGNFISLTASLGDKRVCERSEPIIFKLTLEGSGDFSAILHPPLDLPASMKYYPSKNNFLQGAASLGLSGKKEFEYILQIDTCGEATIPPQAFVYFDPDKKELVTLHSEAQKIMVRGSEPEATTSLPGKNDQQTADDSSKQSPASADGGAASLQALKNINLTNPITTSFWVANRKLSWPWFWGWMLLILLLALLLRLKQQLTKAYQRRYCLSITLRRLHQIAEQGEVLQFYRVVISFFACKLDIDEQELTYDMLGEAILQRYRIPAQNWQKFLHFLQQCQEASFGSRKIQITEMRQLLVTSEKWLSAFDKLFKTGVMQEEL